MFYDAVKRAARHGHAVRMYGFETVDQFCFAVSDGDGHRAVSPPFSDQLPEADAVAEIERLRQEVARIALEPRNPNPPTLRRSHPPAAPVDVPPVAAAPEKT